MKVVAVVFFALASLLMTPAVSQAAPDCSSAAIDPDGDGWGWENNTSCRIVTNTCVDTDGDGWGWDGTDSCRVTTTAECIDEDGDGWGWDGTDSCRVSSPEPSACVDTEPLNDTWGWNGIRSCRMVPVLTAKDTSAIAGFWDGSDEEDTFYINISTKGFLMYYTSLAPIDDCFVEENPNEDLSMSGIQILPVGNNTYEIYSYDFFNETLVEDRELQELTVTVSNTLKISYTDTYIDESGNYQTEIISAELPSAPVATASDLTLCDI